MSEHFPIFVSQNSPSKICKENHYYLQKITIHKRVLHDPKQTKFKADLHLIATQYIISQKKNSKREIHSNLNCFHNYGPRPTDTMEKQEIQKIALARTKVIY